MILEKNQIIETINDNWDTQLKSVLEEFLIEEGRMVFGKDFDYPPDNIVLDDAYIDDIIDFDREKEDFGNVRISGILQVVISMTGMSYWDGEYNYIGEVETSVLVKFSYLSKEGVYKDYKFEVIC